MENKYEQRKRFLKCWHSNRPMQEKIRRASDILAHSDKEVYDEMTKNYPYCTSQYLAINEIEFERNLSFEDQLISAYSEKIKSILTENIALIEKIKSTENVIKKLQHKHQKDKLISILNRSLTKNESRIFRYILSKYLE
jgi:DNA-directed RNA polymerase subunit H (RpoH/RPB5)